MGYRVILALLEGSHDVAFIYRILKENGFETTTKKIKELPKPLDNYLSNSEQFLAASFKEMKIGAVNLSSFPSEVLEKDRNTVVLFSTGGVTRSEIRKEIIKYFNAVKGPGNSGSAHIDKELSISILYLLDAEKEGIKFRLNAIAKEINEIMKVEGKKIEFMENTEYRKINDLYFGAYVFTKPDNNTGRLEDTLLPLMEKDNKDIFDDASAFLGKINEYSLFKDKTNNQDVKFITHVDGQKFDYEKSLMGTVGQLQTSGKSNIQTIREGSFLTSNKILNDPVCKEIAEFFNKSLL